jgi:methionyl aminopeptidase
MQLSEQQIEYMRIAGKMTANALKYAQTLIKPGISTYELDKLVHEYIIKNGGIAAFYKHDGFPSACCISVNDVVVHGIPSKHIVLKEGDIVSIDVGVVYNGYYGDAARTFPVGQISKPKQELIRVAEECFYKGIEKLKVGGYLGDVSWAIQEHAEKNGFSVVRELVGHGIGNQLHMDPQIPNYGHPGKGYILKQNQCLAIEPMINLGKRNVVLLDDGWTVCTADGQPSVHYENTVLLTANGVEILTL